MCHLRLGFIVLYRLAQRSLDVHSDNGKSVSSDSSHSVNVRS